MRQQCSVTVHTHILFNGRSIYNVYVFYFLIQLLTFGSSVRDKILFKSNKYTYR